MTHQFELQCRQSSGSLPHCEAEPGETKKCLRVRTELGLKCPITPHRWANGSNRTYTTRLKAVPKFSCCFERQWDAPDTIPRDTIQRLQFTGFTSPTNHSRSLCTAGHLRDFIHPHFHQDVSIPEGFINRFSERENPLKLIGWYFVSPSTLKHCTADHLSPDMFSTITRETSHSGLFQGPHYYRHSQKVQGPQGLLTTDYPLNLIVKRSYEHLVVNLKIAVFFVLNPYTSHTLPPSNPLVSFSFWIKRKKWAPLTFSLSLLLIVRYIQT